MEGGLAAVKRGEAVGAMKLSLLGNSRRVKLPTVRSPPGEVEARDLAGRGVDPGKNGSNPADIIKKTRKL